LPIREWDGHASHENKELRICANRGVNGIDGTISTFLGLAAPQQNNWAIVGDLTALYDMAAFWVLPQLQDLRVTIVIVNNQGGQIFASIYPEKHFQNPHTVSFSHLAALWQVDYQRWTAVESPPANNRNCIIELIPDNSATARFSDKLQQRKQQLLADMSLAKANVLC
jgi:2-succinyl-5-enolpyruvyl-6-hydroxy-3-cyclohexene-1-carboxylate synthase